MTVAVNNKIKFFLYKLLILCGVIIVTDVIAGFALKSLFYKQRSGKYFTTSHALWDCKEEILIFGNSHAAQHFNAPLVKKKLAKTVFNFGNQGQSMLYIYPLIKSILTYHKPKLIILNIDYNELHYDVTDYQRLSVYLPYYHYNSVIDTAISLVGANEGLKAISSLYRYNSTIGYVLLNTYNQAYNKSINSLGYDPIIGNMCTLDKKNSINEENPFNRKIVFDTLKINCLIKLVRLIQAKHIKLLVTTTPLFQHDAAESDVYKDRLKETLNKLNVDYLDYGNNTSFKEKCDLFHDVSHLNTTGADLWTNVCINYIKDKIL